MASKTVPYSVRLSEEEAEYLTHLTIDQATTPSDKIRNLIKQSKEKEVSKTDFKSCMRYLNNYFLPLLDIVHIKEFEGDQQARCLKRIIEWIPDFCAYLIANNTVNIQDMVGFERGVLRRIFDLFREIIQLHLAQTPVCYDTDYLEKSINEMIQFSELVQSFKNKTKSEN